MAAALADQDIALIKLLLDRGFGSPYRLWLFGSRARGETGGDIDLYAEVEAPRDNLLLTQQRLRRELEAVLHQKVDLVVRRTDGEETAFHRLARDQGVAL